MRASLIVHWWLVVGGWYGFLVTDTEISFLRSTSCFISVVEGEGACNGT